MRTATAMMRTAESESVITIRMEFGPWGYHATPWGHYVNEGIPEFPPSPYRLVRALVDVWKRERPGWSEEKVIPILSALSIEPPVFSLPPYSEYSVPMYQDTNTGDPRDGALVYDSFVMMDSRDAVYAKWKDASLTPSQFSDLSELLSLVDYLGRSESWVDITLLSDDPKVEWNCVPSVSGTRNAVIAVPAPMHSDRDKWFDALTQTTAQASRMGAPRGIAMVSYSLPSSSSSRHIPSASGCTGISAVLYSLMSVDLPPITMTVAISDRVHIKLMGIFNRLFGHDIPPQLSGRNPDGTVWIGPGPISVWPMDSDGDGKLDIMLISSDQEFSPHVLKSLTLLNRLWQTERIDLHLSIIGQGSVETLLPRNSFRTFVSETPLIPKRHYRKRLGTVENWLYEEVVRECGKRGLPPPQSISLLDQVEKGGSTFRWNEYQRNRKGGNPMPAFLMQLTFPSPINISRFALGYDSHFGSGLFAGAA